MAVDSKHDFSEIPQTVGFRNIARAIRLSTVTARYYREERNDRRYDVRYELNADLRRVALYPDKFISKLTDFIEKYNTESAQVREREAKRHNGNIPPEVVKTLRGRVSEDDLDAIIYLTGKYGSEIVCKMLLGYGTSSEKSNRGEESFTELLTEEN